MCCDHEEAEWIQSHRNFKPVKRFQNRNDVFEFWSLDNNFIYRPTAAIILPILNV